MSNIYYNTKDATIVNMSYNKLQKALRNAAVISDEAKHTKNELVGLAFIFRYQLAEAVSDFMVDNGIADTDLQ